MKKATSARVGQLRVVNANDTLYLVVSTGVVYHTLDDCACYCLTGRYAGEKFVWDIDDVANDRLISEGPS